LVTEKQMEDADRRTERDDRRTGRDADI